MPGPTATEAHARRTPATRTRPKPWRWPNLVAADAALAAVAWQALFAMAHGAEAGPTAAWTLGLSVWLVYTADRLFDARRAAEDAPLSRRHAFARDHRRVLVALWAAALGTDAAIAFHGLAPVQLVRGAGLLGICLAYTLARQTIRHRIFPKEALVAAIFAAGAVVFLPGVPWLGGGVAPFAWICWVNCLAVGVAERRLDHAMGDRASLAEARIGPRFIAALALAALPLAAVVGPPPPLARALAFAGLGLACVAPATPKLDPDDVRALADGVIFAAPAAILAAA